jgi:hypothetical protein
MSNEYKSWLEALSEGQREEFLDSLVMVYEHLISPVSSEGEKPEWIKAVAEDVLRQKRKADTQKEQIQ